MAKKKNPNFGDTVPRPRVRLKSPDWRYRYVSDLLDDFKKPRTNDDKAVKALFKFMKCLRSETADKIETYKDNNPDIADAFTIFENGSAYRVDIDTRIIAGYSFEEVALIIGRPKEVIEHYVQCFFDILDHIDNKGYLNRWVLEPVMRVAPYSTEALWKRLAIVGGKPMIEAVQNCSAPELDKLFENLFDNLLLSKGIQAANGIVPNPMCAVELINLAQTKIENRKRLESTVTMSDDDNFTTQVVSVMLKSFAFGMVSEDKLEADPLRSGAEGKKSLEDFYGDNPPKFLESKPSEGDGNE